MAAGYDAIIIGSGFGGAITACRLAEAGLKVLILERGRWWDKDTYPRKPGDPWIWDQAHPERQHGWLDLRIFPDMTVAQGSGVGGGSLIYANVSVEAPPSVFGSGWPAEITYSELKPYYGLVGKMLDVQVLPENQWNPRTKLIQGGATNLGRPDLFRPLPLAVTFDPDLAFDPAHPPSLEQTKKFTNPYGKEQGTCVHAGYCDIGCPVYAKNTLDLNYIALAEKHQAEVRPLHIVTSLEPGSSGYRVSYQRINAGELVPGSETAPRVIVAAGSLGSTELLLRCRDLTHSLPALSQFLGRNWSSNGDFLTPAIYQSSDSYPTRGPTISAAIDFYRDAQQSHSFWVQDGGFPDLLKEYLQKKASGSVSGLRAKLVIDSIRHLLNLPDPFQGIMPWFSQALDAADGRLSLKRPWWVFGPKRLHLNWKIDRSEAVMNAVVEMHKRLADLTGGKPIVPPGWFFSKDLITPHPLGGCNMGVTPEDGVVDHQGRVFGYDNLYIADGAIIPRALGVNPSRTIGALAERIAKLVIARG